MPIFELSVPMNLLYNCWVLILITFDIFISFFIGHWQFDSLYSVLYPINLQLFSHKYKLFFTNSFFLSSIGISVPLFDFEEKQISLQDKGILQPKNDVVFKALFTKGKESITKAFIEDILKIKIKTLDLDKSKDLVNDNKEDKNGRLDLRAVLNDDIECDIELQLKPHAKQIERFLYYWAKLYASNLKVGHEYTKLRKTISIII